MQKIILASASPRRSEILRQIGLGFDIVPSDLDESGFDFGSDICAGAANLARLKAMSVAASLSSGHYVIGADTIVVLDDAIFGKPSDRDDAHSMLRALSGKVHNVITGIAVTETGTGRVRTACASTAVTFAELTDHDIDKYMSTGEYADKAGAYAIQGHGAVLVEKIDGCYYNVVGLPVNLLLKILNGFGALNED